MDLQGHLSLQRSLPSAGPCCPKLPFLLIIGPRPFPVCRWGSFWPFGCVSTADHTWNQLSNSFTAFSRGPLPGHRLRRLLAGLRALLAFPCSGNPSCTGADRLSECPFYYASTRKLKSIFISSISQRCTHGAAKSSSEQ